jgi:phosphoglycolate phosphatase-like HAD superfamily hydrolase
MLSDVAWFGIDFSFTLMNPLTMHHSQVIPAMYRELGRAEEGSERLARWHRLRDSMGSPSDPPHQKVRLMKEYNRDRLHAEVFDNDPQVIALYAAKEAKERRPPEGVKEALQALRDRGKILVVVSEVSSVQGTQTIADFLRAHELAELFDEIITPAGSFTPQGKLLDGVTFKGANKKEGTLYARLATYLDTKGIGARRRAMMGDDPKQDIEAARKQGFVTIQYKGIVDRGPPEHVDLVVSHWKELAEALRHRA